MYIYVIVCSTAINTTLYSCANFFYSDHSEFPSASSSTASSTVQSDLGSSENETSTSYSIPPSPKQPCIESEPEVSVVNIDIADLAKRISSLTEHEKYHFYCHRSLLISTTSFHLEVVVLFNIDI